MIIKTELGAMLDAPAWESHKRGKNWCAIIKKDPLGPGGLGRTFLKAAKGQYYYMVGGLKPGDPVEFGGDYYSGSGTKHSNRWYGYVVRVAEDEIEFCQSKGPQTAIKEGAAYATQMP